MGTIAKVALTTVLLTYVGSTQQAWVALGPFGGSVRTLAYDPQNPDHVFLGTSAGQLYASKDGGASWAWVAQFGDGEYVLDNIAVDPRIPNLIYAATWRLEGGGEFFRSRDGGKSWQSAPVLHGKSVRALALAPSDPRVIVVGALDGVFRSSDAGETWERISPLGDSELKNVESLAIDPMHPEVIYVGTWHLPWKTTDGGRTWHPIHEGLVDDSDVFAITVDQEHPAVVYASACTGIYRSEDGGELFRKLQGIPESARRTRSLQQDPSDRNTIYAGTTEGLWKTTDAGRNWRRLTAANVVVNHVVIDPRRPGRVLLATESGGVLASDNGGNTFQLSNSGFANRRVTSAVVDRGDARTIYAVVANDEHSGGIFISRDAGAQWTRMTASTGTLDVITLRQAEDGTLVAGTATGIFTLARNAGAWVPHSLLADPDQRLMTARVTQLELLDHSWLAATSAGLFSSLDGGAIWQGGPLLGEQDLIGVAAAGRTVLAASSQAVLVSRDGGAHWRRAALPEDFRSILGVAVGSDSTLWLATSQGAFCSRAGRAWQHVIAGVPARNLIAIAYDSESHRLFGASASGEIFESADSGLTWALTAETGWPIRNLIVSHGRVLAVTLFGGLLAQPEPITDASSPAGKP